jgi:hypothetical protein
MLFLGCLIDTNVKTYFNFYTLTLFLIHKNDNYQAIGFYAKNNLCLHGLLSV